jgi:hypothetical protein
MLQQAETAPATKKPRLRVTRAVLARQFRSLDPNALTSARDAAARLVATLREFAAAGRVPLEAAVPDALPEAWKQYEGSCSGGADGDLHYYYHSHGKGNRHPEEHGHFHVFASLPPGPEGTRRHSHLVAIAVDARGVPQRLFTTNRWVTNEVWLDAPACIALAECVAGSLRADASLLDRWVCDQIALFAPQISLLLSHRDRRVVAWRRSRLLEDRRIHVLSECKVSLGSQVAEIERVSQAIKFKRVTS